MVEQSEVQWGNRSAPGGRRRRRRGIIGVDEGGGCDEMFDIAGMGLMMLCEFEYYNDACFAAAATNDGKDDDRGERALPHPHVDK